MNKKCLQSCFINEEKNLRNTINNINKVNCIEQYAKYLNIEIDPEIFPLEYEFNKALNDYNEKFIRNVLMLSFKNKYKDNHNKCISDLIEVNMDAPYSFVNANDNCELDWFIKNFISDKEFYSLMIEQMHNILTVVLNQCEKSNKEKGIAILKNRITQIEQSIEDKEKQLNELKTKLEKEEENK